MKLRFYGKLADLFGSEREIAVEGAITGAQVRQRLALERPDAADTLNNKRVRACIGDAIVQETDVVPEGQVLELLAPVSGG